MNNRFGRGIFYIRIKSLIDPGISWKFFIDRPDN
jgi:hypothetical protein